MDERQEIFFKFLKLNKLMTNKNIRHIFTCDYIKSDICVNFFDRNIHWNSTEEGFNFWLKTQCEWLKFLILKNKRNLFSNFEEYYCKLIDEGYFSLSTMTKHSTYYIEFVKFYVDHTKKPKKEIVDLVKTLE